MHALCPVLLLWVRDHLTIPPSLNRNNIPSKVSDDDAKRISSSLPLCSIKTPPIPIFMRLWWWLHSSQITESREGRGGVTHSSNNGWGGWWRTVVATLLSSVALLLGGVLRQNELVRSLRRMLRRRSRVVGAGHQLRVHGHRTHH